MPKTTLKVGLLDADMGWSSGTHMWVVKDATFQKGGYEKLPEWVEKINFTATAGHKPRGAFNWRGAYTGRLYVATDDKLWEVTDSAATNVTGSALTNATHGVTFASYGEWCFAANGVNKIQAIQVPSALASATNFADMTYTTGGAKIAPKYICSHKNHIVAADITFIDNYAQIASFTTAVGSAFTNQPTGDTIQILSSDAAEVAGAGKYVTVYGTYTGGGDAVRAQQILINGTTAVDSSDSNWQKILGVNCSFNPVAASTITVRKKTGTATITTFTTAAGSGIQSVPADSQGGGDKVLQIVASAATTKQIGVIGTGIDNAALWDSQALTGTTAVTSNSAFRSFAYILTGDIENTVTATVSSYVYPIGYNDPYLVWWSGTDDPEGYGTEIYAPQVIGSSNQPLLDGVGKITGVVDGGDCFFVFKSGSIYRFDGPPFQPTVIESTKGMPLGNAPYRQGSRIYFWSEDGLNYVDINNNQVVNVTEKYVQRALTDESVDQYGGRENLFPASRQSSILTANNLCTAGVVQISGDVANSMIWVMYFNDSVSSSGVAVVYSGIIYHEKTEAFVHITPPVDTDGFSANRTNIRLVSYRSESGSEVNGIGSYIRCIFASSSTSKMNVYGMERKGFFTSNTRDVYLRWPFWGGEADSPKSRIVRVRPIFDSSVPHFNGAEFTIKAEVVSISGTQKAWQNMGTYSTGQGTSSKDGWVTVDGCPFADSHSIGISILGTNIPNRPAPYLVNFVGVEVDYVTGPSKSI